MKHLKLITMILAMPKLVGKVANALVWSGGMQYVNTFGSSWANKPMAKYLMGYASLLKTPPEAETIIELAITGEEYIPPSEAACKMLKKHMSITDIKQASLENHTNREANVARTSKSVDKNKVEMHTFMTAALAGGLTKPPVMTDDDDQRIINTITKKVKERQVVLVGLASIPKFAAEVDTEMGALNKVLELINVIEAERAKALAKQLAA